jgi:hypothetical protein
MSLAIPLYMLLSELLFATSDTQYNAISSKRQEAYKVGAQSNNKEDLSCVA